MEKEKPTVTVCLADRLDKRVCLSLIHSLFLSFTLSPAPFYHFKSDRWYAIIIVVKERHRFLSLRSLSIAIVRAAIEIAYFRLGARGRPAPFFPFYIPRHAYPIFSHFLSCTTERFNDNTYNLAIPDWSTDRPTDRALCALLRARNPSRKECFVTWTSFETLWYITALGYRVARRLSIFSDDVVEKLFNFPR